MNTARLPMIEDGNNDEKEATAATTAATLTTLLSGFSATDKRTKGARDL